MLVLTRGARESIKIGDNSQITVDEVHGNDFVITVVSPLKKLIRQAMSAGDRISLGPDILILLTKTSRHPDVVKLVIHAPRHIPVDRVEIWARKRAFPRGKLTRSA